MADGFTIIEMFDYSPGNHALTEEVIYGQQPSDPDDVVPVFSGSSDNETGIATIHSHAKTGKGEDVAYFTGPCLILTKDGSAGLLTYKGVGEKFTTNHHACVLRLKDEWQGRVNLAWFAQQYQSRFLACASSKSDNRVFSVDWFDRLKFRVPRIEVQDRQEIAKTRLSKVAAASSDAAAKLRALLSASVKFGQAEATYVGPIAGLFVVRGGNSGLTEQFIYHHMPIESDRSVTIRSGATMSENEMGEVAEGAVLPNGRPLRVFEGECLLVTRNGFYAGTLSHWAGGRFATNDHMYVLVPQKKYAKLINLKWFAANYAQLFRGAVTSKTDNANFNKNWMSKMEISLPPRSYQDAAAEKLSRWQSLAEGLEQAVARAESLLSDSFA